MVAAVRSQDTHERPVSRFRYALPDGDVEEVLIADDVLALPLSLWSLANFGTEVDESWLLANARLPGSKNRQIELARILRDALERHWAAVAARTNR